MRATVPCLLALLTTQHTGPQGQPLTALERRALGCYWISAGVIDQRRFDVHLDSTFVAGASSDSGSPPQRRLILPRRLARIYELSSWGQATGDSIAIAFSAGLGGVSLIVAVAPDSLTGRVETWTDVLGSTRTVGTTIAHRKRC